MSEYTPTTEMRDRIEDALMDYGRDREDAAYSSMVKPDLAGALAEILSVLAVARREGQVEALRAAANTDDPDHDTEVALGGSDYVHVWLHVRANRIENGASDE